MTSRTNLESLASSASVMDLRRLRGRISTHLDLLEEASFEADFLDIGLAREIATVLITLVDSAEALDSHQRALLRGAIDYFILTNDENDDLGNATGLEDDAAVTNAVCRALSRDDLLIGVGPNRSY